MSIGEQIKKYRDASGLKQVALEELSGVSGGTISAMEKRGSLSSRFLPQLAKAFGLTVDQLMDEATDYADHVRAFVAKQLQQRRSLGPVATVVSEQDPAPWARPSASAWPFSVSRERVAASLHPQDIARVDAYILALVETRELEALQAGVKNNGTHGAAQR